MEDSADQITWIIPTAVGGDVIFPATNNDLKWKKEMRVCFTRPNYMSTFLFPSKSRSTMGNPLALFPDIEE
jgi:hypothetical protein